jgi:hypothetical protein
MKASTLANIQAQVRVLRIALDKINEFFYPDSKIHGGRNIHGLSTASLVMQHMCTITKDVTPEYLQQGLDTIRAIHAATGLGNHYLSFVIEQLDMIISGNLMSEDYEEDYEEYSEANCYTRDEEAFCNNQ